MVPFSVLVKHKHENWKRSIDSCISHHKKSIVNRDCNKVENNHKDCLDYRNDEASMNDKLAERCRSFVRQSSMPEH